MAAGMRRYLGILKGMSACGGGEDTVIRTWAHVVGATAAETAADLRAGRESEVGQEQSAVISGAHDILGFEVAVEDGLIMAAV